MSNIEFGKIGEAYALKYLVSMRHKIIKTNFAWRGGEIDIISYDNLHSQLVFTEVKTRSGSTYGYPEESITYAKAKRLTKTALHFLGKELRRKISWRIDLIALKLTKKGVMKSISHLTNILNDLYE